MREYHIYTINLEEADGSILPWDTLQVKNGCVTAYCRQSGPPLAVVTDRNLPAAEGLTLLLRLLAA